MPVSKNGHWHENRLIEMLNLVQRLQETRFEGVVEILNETFNFAVFGCVEC